MERQPIKVLFLYFGQPRMIKECMPWHDHLINYLQSENVEIDIEYHLWDKYFDRVHHQSSPSEYIDVDCDELENYLSNSRPCNIKCNFYSYHIVDLLYNNIKDYLNHLFFHHRFSQTISKGLACKNISDKYDVVCLFRPDLIFNPNYYSEFLNFLSDYSKEKDDNILYVNQMNYYIREGLKIDDTRLFGKPNSLKTLYDNYEEKIISYVKNTKKDFIEQHHIAINFGNFYKHNDSVNVVFKNIKDKKPYKIKSSIARPVQEVREYLKEISADSYNEVDEVLTYFLHK